MQAIRKVLVPVDLSKHSTPALDWAIAFARDVGAEVELAHCYEVSPLLGIYGHHFPGSYDSALQRAAGAGLADLAHRVAGQGVRVREHLLRGDPSEAIVACAESLDVDVIAMGTRGQGGLQKWLLGSVAARVIQNAPCPVVAVRSESAV